MVLLQLSDRSGKTQKLNHLPGFRPAGFSVLVPPESLFLLPQSSYTSDFRLWFPSFGISPSVFSKSFFLLIII
nr:MAG TPA: hypothetical protein [Caudoviricetes sp.]